MTGSAVSPAPEQKTDGVVGTTAEYNKITYSASRDYPIFTGPGAIEINLDAGTLNLDNGITSTSCKIDNTRLLEARTLMAESKICVPPPPPSGTLTCMAISIADIQLSNDSKSIMLRPLLCSSGTFLCDDNDEKLRTLIADLRDNPPASCH